MFLLSKFQANLHQTNRYCMNLSMNLQAGKLEVYTDKAQVIWKVSQVTWI
jgi:hypothetical protein